MAFKSNTLTIGSYYDVICSDVESDSWIFSVQLISSIEELNDMTFKLQNCELENLQEKPLLGMACIARFPEDNQLYRAIIVNIKQTRCQVAYVDYGNTDEVPFENVYEIPSEFLEQKIFATQFILSGLHELASIDDDHIKTAFKNSILNKELRLKVMPLEGPPLVQYCNLYDNEIDILNLIKNIKNEKCDYSKPETIKTGDVVIICYVESPKSFYVQKVNDIEIFDEIMNKLFLYYTKSKSPIKILEKNAACVAKFEDVWYRAQIISIENDNARVKFVDYGNERLIPIEQLFSICEEFVKLSPQAIKCCLKGFENTEDFSESATTQLEILAESEDGNRRHFKCQLYEIKNNECIVNLTDETIRPELSLMKKLYMLSMPFNTYIELINNSNTGEITQNQQSKYSSNKENLFTNISNSTVTSCKEKYSPLSNNTFKINNLKLQTHETVKISWWISPHKFYIQINKEIKVFKNMMKNIQSFYKNIPSIRSMKNNKNKIENFQINDVCIIYHTKDKLFYRAKILAFNENIKKYKVKLVDIGSSIIVDENSIWYVEEDFTKLPIMSYECSFDDIILKLNHKDILKYVEKHVQPDTAFNCEFIRKDLENDLYYVELKSNDVSLKELLINDGAISTINEDMDVKLLCGQKIKAKILAFNDLLHFEIEIDGCDLKLLCSYNDIKFVKSNPNLSIEFKNTYEGTSCIIDILDVTNDKILMVQPLIPLFNINIPKQIICNYPIINRKFNVNIAYVETSNIIYVHPKIRQDSLNKLLDDMFEYYETEGKIMEEKTIGSLCAVKSSDQNWYRARIISSENDTITVFYVDYGNTEDIENIEKNIKVLENEFIEVSAFAIRIFLPIKCNTTLSESTNENIIDELNLITDDKSQLKLNIIELYKSSWIAEILINNDNAIDQNFINILNEKSIIQGTDFEYVKNLIDNNSEQLILNSVEKEFYGDIYNDGESLNEQETNDINGVEKEFYGESLNEEETNKMEGVEKEFSGNAYNDGESLNEQETNDINGVEKEFYGESLNEEETNDVDGVEKEFSGNAYNDRESLNEQETNNTSEINKSDNQFKNQNENKSQFNNNMLSAYLSYYDNPGKFLLHLKENYENLMKMQDDIQTVASSLPPLMNIVTGELCIALCSGDDTWYRAKIVDNKLMKIQYIDYGNIDVLTDSSFIKEMDKKFIDIEPFAIPCSLPIYPNGTTDWVDEANLIFEDMYDKELHFKYISKGYVDLIIDGQNVAEKLIADGLALRLEVIEYGEKCLVSHINNLSDFYIQLKTSVGRLELIVDYLSQAENFPHLENFVVGDMCAAIFPDDGEWYRAMLIEKFDDDVNNIEYYVLFVDYGNKSIVKDVRQISDEIANLPHVSIKCSLLKPDYILEWSKPAEYKFFELSGLGETLFTVELIEFLEDHAVVNLFVENTNILEELILCEKKESNINLIEETFEKNLKINDYNEEENNNENVVLGNDELDTTKAIEN